MTSISKNSQNEHHDFDRRITPDRIAAELNVIKQKTHRIRELLENGRIKKSG